MNSSPQMGLPPRTPGHIWRFGDCELDELRRELRIRELPVEIEAKPFEVLRQLLLHAGEVVTKDELLESVWPGLTVVDGSLATAVSKLRKALGDDSMVVTIPRLGYRLAVPVHSKPTEPQKSQVLNLNPGDPVPGRTQWQLAYRLEISPSSDVWLAKHSKTHAQRVFKFALDTARLKGLKREVTLSRLLNESLGDRPEFVRILEWNFETVPYFIECEYSGRNLAEWAEAEGGLTNIPQNVRVNLLADVARAVAAAHDLGVLHKDLKPGNILISTSPEGNMQIKIADFGSAALLAPSRLADLGITNMGFTHTGDLSSLSGTIMYVAPEVLGGQSPTTASDVYALGMLLYQLLVGDFRKPLAPGWEAGVPDALLREDIAEAACGDPIRRLKSAAEFGLRLKNLEQRRTEREAFSREQQRSSLAAQRRAQIRSRLPWILIAAVVLVTIVVGFFAFRRNRTQPPLRIKTVAVLPFQNVSSDNSLDYLRLALPDEIANNLSHARGLAVRSFAETSKYNHSIDPRSAAREMRVGTLVTGHFIKTEDQLRITLEAIDVETNGVLWRDQVIAPVQSMIAMEVEISLRVRRGLTSVLGGTALESGAQPKNEEAYELFLRGAAMSFDMKSIEEAKQKLEKAVQMDPTYAPAWHALARVYSQKSHFTKEGRGSMDQADAANEQALALDPNYIPARMDIVLSRVERGDLVRAYREGKDLVSRYPDNPDVHFSLSYVFRYAGLLQQSGKECDTALLLFNEQNPTLSLRSCAMAFLLDGDYRRSQNYLNYYSDSDFATSLSIDILLRQGKEQDALQLVQNHTPQWAGYQMLMAHLQHKPRNEIDKLAAGVQLSADPETNYLAGGHLAYAGYSDLAMTLLMEAIKGNYCSYPALDKDPLFASLRTKTEFSEVRNQAIQCQQNFLTQAGE